MKNKQPALLVLIPGFPANEADSTCLPSHQDFVRAVNAQFPELRIVVLAFDYPFISSAYQWYNNSIFPFNGSGKRKFKILFKWVAVWRKMKAIKRKNNIIGVLSFWCGECAYMGKWFAKKNRLKHLCWIMGQDARKENHYVNRIKPVAGDMVAISDFIQKEFSKNHGIQPQHVIPFGIAANEFPKGDCERDIDILGVGSLISLKQYDVFVEVIKKLKEDFPGIKAVLCGKGPEEGNLLQMIKNFGLQKNIVLTGELPHNEVLQQMKRAKLFLHCSNYEGFGVVCIEALYAGTPVISFCKPMNMAIQQWVHVIDMAEMIQKSKALLTASALTPYLPVMPFAMANSVKRIMMLLGYKENASF